MAVERTSGSSIRLTRYRKSLARKQGTASGKVGRGFIPGTNMTKSLWALAPEVRFSILPSQNRLIASEISPKRTSGPKGRMIGHALVPGINPRPTLKPSFSVAYKAVPFVEESQTILGSMRSYRLLKTALCLAIIFASAYAMAAETPGFNTQVAPILQKNCLACHSSGGRMGGLVMESYDSLIKGGTHGAPIVPGNADGSRIIQMLEGKIAPRMPYGGDPLPPADIATIKAWINAGATGPAAGSAVTTLAPAALPDIRPVVPVVSPVASLKFSPDGSLLAVGGYREVRLIDPSSGKELATLSGHADYVRSIAFSPDGKMLAAGGGPPQRSGEIKIWDLQSHQLLKTMQGHKDCIYSVAWSPDGKIIASGSYDKMVKLWDVASGKELKNLQDHIDAVFALSFSPDGKHLASASQDRTVKIWDVSSGNRLYTLSDALDGLTGVAYSPSGEHVAAAGYDKTIYIWKVGDTEGALKQSLIGDEDSILALVWSPDGKTIITASSDGSIRFRDAATLDPLRVIDHQPEWVQALAISPDGRFLAAGRFNGTLSLYDVKNDKTPVGEWTVFAPRQPAAGEGKKQVASQ
jgi:dipeptidyl aminopeptidase/acylaminoacyl peptidase